MKKVHVAIIAASCATLSSSAVAAGQQPAKPAEKPAPATQPAKQPEKTAPARSPQPKPAERAPNTITDDEKAKGWVLLFDGKDTSHFRGYKTDAFPDNWEVADGTLHCKPGSSGPDLVTKDQYGDFEFVGQVKVSPKGNSGIMYRVSETAGAAYETGPEYQVLDNKGHGDGVKPETSMAACYGLYACKTDATKPVGEWNDFRIVIKKGTVQHWLNGQLVVEYQWGSEEVKKLIEASKFKAWSGFAKNDRGFIALQNHGDSVWYRDLKIRTLD